MDFIMHLPKTNNGHTALLVVVDKLSKMMHLIPTTVQVSGKETARLYVNHALVQAFADKMQQALLDAKKALETAQQRQKSFLLATDDMLL